MILFSSEVSQVSSHHREVGSTKSDLVTGVLFLDKKLNTDVSNFLPNKKPGTYFTNPKQKSLSSVSYPRVRGVSFYVTLTKR